MEERLQTAVNVEAGKAVLSLYGELDLTHAPLLEQAIEDPQVASAGMLILDLRELRFLDSSGLRTILRAQEECRKRGQKFAVTPAFGQVQRLLSITHASDELEVVAASDGHAAADL
jgi:anti-sigma B factor antagonist